MKFLLTAINAKFIHSNPAIYSLRAGVGEKLQPYVELAEFTINESLESILEGIWKRQPKGNRIFLLYLELEADPGNSDGIAEDPAGYGDLAGRTGGDL